MTCCEAAYSEVEAFAGLATPIPPSRQSNTKSLLSSSFGGALPVRFGMKEHQMVSSRG